ncbi:uncharacterized protein B0T23DRAFT_405611 [Neurospora hispaniola]|uniref:Uncharacterized protein n=1 Tax=Neurospora hispaniola TaxID=588809 RepID=A0AAJ0I5V1_9PEZI|nr:hypothetical protein B0T23DRAFT_405611 [Neurospora hispaniola]
MSNANQANKGMKQKSENSTQGITLNFHRQAVVQLMACKADGGTACCSVASEPSVALVPLPCHGSLSRVFKSNLPTLSVEGPKRSTLLTRPGTAACAMGKIAASASWGDYSPFGSDRDRLHSSKNFCISMPRNNGPIGCFGFCAHFTCTILPPTRKRTQAWRVQAVHGVVVSYTTAIRK